MKKDASQSQKNTNAKSSKITHSLSFFNFAMLSEISLMLLLFSRNLQHSRCHAQRSRKQTHRRCTKSTAYAHNKLVQLPHPGWYCRQLTACSLNTAYTDQSYQKRKRTTISTYVFNPDKCERHAGNSLIGLNEKFTLRARHCCQ